MVTDQLTQSETLAADLDKRHAELQEQHSKVGTWGWGCKGLLPCCLLWHQKIQDAIACHLPGIIFAKGYGCYSRCSDLWMQNATTVDTLYMDLCSAVGRPAARAS